MYFVWYMGYRLNQLCLYLPTFNSGVCGKLYRIYFCLKKTGFKSALDLVIFCQITLSI